MKKFTKIFWSGLIVVLPVTMTVYLLMWFTSKAEGVFGDLLEKILGEDFYIPGFGILVLFSVIMAVGLLTNHYLTSKLINSLVKKLEQVPLIKAIYNPLKDLMGLFGKTGESNKNMKRVVLVTTDQGLKMLGLVTRDEFSELKSKDMLQDKLIVYVPCAYMLGGFTMIVEKSRVLEIDMPVDEALKLAITGWAKA